MTWIPMRIAAVAVVFMAAACNGSESEAPTTPAVPAPALSELPSPYNAADLDNGKLAFNKCRACHSLVASQGNRVGPNLHGVFDRDIASAPKFRYSRALADFAEPRWTPELIDHWLANPKSFLPGNGMFFDGIAMEADRQDLIAYLLIHSRD
jgi:cytochrome c